MVREELKGRVSVAARGKYGSGCLHLRWSGWAWRQSEGKKEAACPSCMSCCYVVLPVDEAHATLLWRAIGKANNDNAANVRSHRYICLRGASERKLGKSL